MLKTKLMTEETRFSHRRKREEMNKAYIALEMVKAEEQKKLKRGFKYNKTDDKTWKLQAR